MNFARQFSQKLSKCGHILLPNNTQSHTMKVKKYIFLLAHYWIMEVRRFYLLKALAQSSFHMGIFPKLSFCIQSNNYYLLNWFNCTFAELLYISIASIENNRLWCTMGALFHKLALEKAILKVFIHLGVCESVTGIGKGWYFAWTLVLERSNSPR